MTREWRIRCRWLDGHPPTYFGRFDYGEAIEFVRNNLASDSGQLFDITVSRGDFGGEMDRARARQAKEKETE